MPATSAGVSLAGGTLDRIEREQTVEENDAGLKLVLLLRGKLGYVPSRGREVLAEGPSLHLAASREPFTVRHRHADAKPLQFVAVRISAAALDHEFGVELDGLWRSVRPRHCADATLSFDRRAERSLQALARQMLFCPLQGPTRRMYLVGKALELTAAALTDVGVGDDAICSGDTRYAALDSRDIERLHAARDIVLQRLHAPPTLVELARLAGTNVNKLTRGFRSLFGCTVYDFVREQRLELAYRMLAAGETNVAAAAAACGYTDSHFSKAFRARFGFAPSRLG